MPDPNAILQILRDPNLQTGPYPQWPTLPPMRGPELRNPGSRPQEATAPVSEALSPTMGGYGMGQIAADTLMKAQQGDYAGVAANMPFIVGALKNPVRVPNPIKAYHGSPHDFNEFDLSKIGTGEGAQAYGHGLYFAENPKVAETYKQTPVSIMDRTAALMETGKDTGYSPGHMYEVALHATPEQFLDWDKPLSGQSPEVQAALKKQIPEWDKFSQKTGGDYLNYGLARNHVPLAEADIPGIRYLDQGSRHLPENVAAWEKQLELAQKRGDPNDIASASKALEDARTQLAKGRTHNYSVWSPEIIEILRKYGLIAAPTAGAIANAISQPQQSQQQ